MTNLLSEASASFEDGTVGDWHDYGGSALSNTTEAAFVGTHSLKVTAIDVNILAGTGDIPVTPGNHYRLRLTVRGPNQAQLVTVNAYWYDSGGTYLTNFAASANVNANEWTLYDASFTAPPNAAFLKQMIWIYATVAGEAYYLDAASVEEVIPPAVVSFKRSAWLMLKGQRLDLDDHAAGYAATEVDLGYPEVRDVVSNRPIADGLDDQTAYFGGRTIAVNITAWPGGTVPLDDIPALFQPFMSPAARPELHYTKISASEVERIIVGLRAAAFSSPMGPPGKREMQLQWIAADPLLRDSVVKTATAYAGTVTAPGRSYPQGYNKVYPPGMGSSTTAFLSNSGDVNVKPILRIYGPVTQPSVTILNSTPTADNVADYVIATLPGFLIPAGQYLEVDCAKHTAFMNGDPAQSAIAQLDFMRTAWPVIWPEPNWSWLSIAGSSTSGVTQVQAIWQDLYLS